MIYNPPRIDISQSNFRQSAALFFLLDPRIQGLLDDPSPRPFKTLGQSVNLLRERQRDVCGQDFSFRHARITFNLF